MNTKLPYLFISLMMLFHFNGLNAAPVTLDFSGSINDIATDSGSSDFSGMITGDRFSGSFTYGDSESDAVSPPFISSPSAFWTFEGTGSGASLTTTTGIFNTTSSEVIITNDDFMGAEAAQFVSSLTGQSVSAGDIFDAWEAATFDAGNSIWYSLLYLSLDSSLYSDLSYQATPPSSQNTDLALIFIQQLDEQGTLIYEATGLLDSTSPIPLPAAFWLFLSGLGLIGAMRYRTTGRK